MSIKARLKTIEGKLPDQKEKPKVKKEILLFMDSILFRETWIEFIFALEMNEFEKAETLKIELEKIYKTTDPFLSPDRFDPDEFQELVSYEINKYMDENPESLEWRESSMTDEEKQERFFPDFFQEVE